MGRRLADLFHGRPRLQVGSLLAGPVGWLVIGYLGSLAVLLIASFWSLGELSGEIEQTFTLDNFQTLVDEPVYRTITLRTVVIAALVTVTDALLACRSPSTWRRSRAARSKGAAGRRGAGAALVVLPGQGLRLAHDPQRGRGAQLGCSTRSASPAPATATSPSGW